MSARHDRPARVGTELTIERGRDRLTVTVDCVADATVGELAAAAAAALPDLGSPGESSVVLSRDGVEIAAGAPLVSSGIRRGATVRLQARGAAGPPDMVPAGVETPDACGTSGGRGPRQIVRVVAGLNGGALWPVGAGWHSVSQLPSGEAVVGGPADTGAVAALDVAGNGTVRVAPLVSGSTIELFSPDRGCERLDNSRTWSRDATLIVGSTALIRGDEAPVREARGPAAGFTTVRHRGPAPPAPRVAVHGHAPPAPPEPPRPASFSWAMVLGPLVIGVAFAVLFTPVMAAFALLGPVAAVVTWAEDHHRCRRRARRDRAEWTVAMQRWRAALDRSRTEDRNGRWWRWPDPGACIEWGRTGDARLWSERKDDPDFLRLHLGVGEMPAVHTDGADGEDGAGPLPGCPVTIECGPGSVTGIVGPSLVTEAVLRSLLLQAAHRSGPADLRLIVVAPSAKWPEWDWLRWLPHEPLVAESLSGVEAMLPAGGQGSPAGAGRPVLIVVLDAAANRAATVIRSHAPGPPPAVLMGAADLADLPPDATIVEVLDSTGAARLRDRGGRLGVTGEDARPAAGFLLAGISEETAAAAARRLAPLVDGDASGQVLEAASLLDVAWPGDVQVDAAHVLERWAAGGVDPPARAVLGQSPAGPVIVDLDTDGPHLLVGGTTGSGKSELLRTLVASLALGCSPEFVTFFLIDYKGGSAFDACVGLPHVTGIVTDLDGGTAARALRCLSAELRWREDQLRRAGARDLAGYRRWAGGSAGGSAAGGSAAPPLPRLVVVVDEFAALAAELPGFVDALVGIAQRGRSLGLHLVLATQRPGGALSADIQANTNLRIALRTQDEAESVDIVGAADAAHLDRRRPGQAIVRLGPGERRTFQVASCSTPARAPMARVIVKPWCWPASAQPAGRSSEAHPGESELTRIVDACRGAVELGSLAPPRRPCPPVLPASVSRDSLLTNDDEGGLGVVLGLADDPDAQRWAAYRWAPTLSNLLAVGPSGLGASSALVLGALGLAERMPPSALHIYGLDFGAGGLDDVSAWPHCGGVIGAGDLERQVRLVTMLSAELARRREGPAARAGDQMPAILLLVDNYGALHHAWEESGLFDLREQLVRLLVDGHGFGLWVGMTADRPGSLPISVSASFRQRLVFPLADPHEATLLGLDRTDLLPGAGGECVWGRGVDVATGRLVQLAGVDSPPMRLGDTRRSPAGPRPVERLATSVATEGLPPAEVDGRGGLILPVGISATTVAPVTVRLGAGDHMLVVGPTASGRSSFLGHLADAAAMAGCRVVALAPRPSCLHEIECVRVLAGACELADELGAKAARPTVLVVDDADLVRDNEILGAVVDEHDGDIFVVAAGHHGSLRHAFDHWSRGLRRSGIGLALRPAVDVDGDLWNVALPRRSHLPLGVGRGYLIAQGEVDLVQAGRWVGSRGTERPSAAVASDAA